MGEYVMLGFSGEIAHPLSFVRVEATEKRFWVPQRSGDYTKDCETGAGYAQELMDYIKEVRSPVIFKSVCQAIGEAGEIGGVEIGFYNKIGNTLITL